MSKSTRLQGKVALITGGAKGLGAATAAELLARGASVAIVDIEEPAATSGADSSRREPWFVKGDVTDVADMAAAVDAVVEKFGGLDIVIANAGVAARGATVRATSPQAVTRLFDINVHGVLNTVQAALPQVIERRGNVVVISSVFAYLNGAGTVPYAMSKAAVEQFGRGLRVELASSGVGVHTAYFSMIDTDMIRMSVDEDPVAQALLAALPGVLNKRITADVAARAIADGIEKGSPRVMRPRRWAPVSALRGVLAIALDAKLAGDENTQKLIRDLDARSGQDRLST